MEHKLIWGILLLMILPVALGVQVNSSTEIYSFNVLDCQANVSDIGCAATDVMFSCNITPYAYIDYTLFRIDGIDHTTSRSNEIFSYVWHKPTTSTDTDAYIGLDRGQIHDIGGGDALFFPNASVHLLCDSCAYNITTDACQVNDSHLVHYTGDGSPNCTSYNASEPCDYCVPDWQITSNCLENNTEYRQYQDDNSCYNITGLYADSCSNSFIDCDTWKSCSFLTDDMACDFDVNPLINIAGNKILWKCDIENTSLDYNCISYVKQQGAIIQTQPQQRTYSNGLWSREQETREYFTGTAGLVNPYFTTENLKPNITYVFGVQCSNDIGTLRTEEYVTPIYRSLEDVAYTGIWVKDNIGYIFGLVILVIIIIVVLSLVWGQRK